MKRILIRRVDNLGDMVLALPALKALRNHFKESHITLMVKQEHKSLVKKYADDFLAPLPLENFDTLSKLYQHCINIEYSFPSGYKPVVKNKLPRVFHIGTVDWNKPKHISKHIFDGLRAHGIKGTYSKSSIELNSTAKQFAKTWFAKNKLSTTGNIIVSLDPNSGFEKKCWSIKGFLQVCKYLVEEFNCKIIIPVTAADNEKANYLLRNLPKGNCFLLQGQLIDVVAILAKCDMHIGNDSGVGHLAAAVNTPTVSIFGPTDPLLWKPFGKKSVVVFKKEIECPGGYEHAQLCKLQKCLVRIKPQDVIDGILYCMTKYVDKERFFSLVNLGVSKNLSIQKTHKGYVLANTETNHQCLIKRGWPQVKDVLNKINKTPDSKIIPHKIPKHLHLIDMLMMHRIIETVS
ncbi:MAG: glycosyltransferase family 9 protein [Bacteroidia bacterium]